MTNGYALASARWRMENPGHLPVDIRRDILGIAAIAGFWLVANSPVGAQMPAPIGADQVGHATLVRGTVTGEVQRRTYPVNVGSTVYNQEWVATKRRSQAAFYLSDRSHLDLGEQSRIKLERVTGSDVVLAIGNGSYKFIGGTHEQKTYRIRTPYAIIGIRGTIAEIVIHAGGASRKTKARKRRIRSG